MQCWVGSTVDETQGVSFNLQCWAVTCALLWLKPGTRYLACLISVVLFVKGSDLSSLIIP